MLLLEGGAATGGAFERLDARHFTVRVVDGMVEVAEHVQLVHPHLDRYPEGFALTHAHHCMCRTGVVSV